MERPWERNGFKHRFLVEWVRDHRIELVHAVLILIQRWIASGQPLCVKALGGFESWSRVIGGILDVAEVPGFLDNLRELHDAADTESRGWARLVRRWWDELGDRTVGSAVVFPLLDLEGDAPTDIGLERGKTGKELTAAGKKMAFGSRLAQHDGRIFAGFRLIAVGERHQALQWRLERRPTRGRRVNTGLALMGAWEVWEAAPPFGTKGAVISRSSIVLMGGEVLPQPPSLPLRAETRAGSQSRSFVQAAKGNCCERR